MQSLKEYINKNIFEAFQQIKLKNLYATYIVNNNNPLVLEAPAGYSEDDIKLYLDDRLGSQLPGSFNNNEAFGINKEDIFDCYFEYYKFEHYTDLDSSKFVIDVYWDSKYSDTEVNKLEYYILYNVKYIIKFDKFILNDEDDIDIKDTLDKIFTAQESNSLNNYDINIKFDKEKINFETE